MKNVYLFQPQNYELVNDVKQCWLPYSAGCIWAYASQFEDILSNFTLKKLFFTPKPIDEVISQIEDPAVCGFSTYVWNEQFNLAVAKRIKELWPNCVILFGGAEINAGHLSHKFIDSVTVSEGELHFLSALRHIIHGSELPVIFPKERVQDLLELPSPYVTGVFDDIIRENPDISWNAVVETNRGCPYACTFCDWGSVTYSKVRKFDLDRIHLELEWFTRSNVKTLFIADANFGIYKERDMEIAQSISRICKDSPIEYVNITYTKNSNENVFLIFKELYPLTKAITISMQSMNPPTLEAIKRGNLKINNLAHLMDLAEKYQVPTYTDMILGLPLETVETWRAGMAELLEAGQHNQIDVFVAILIRNSELATPESRRQYGIKSVQIEKYMTLVTEPIDGVPPELVELVSSTSTMTTEDMVDAFMYSWVVSNMHLMGYSQIVSAYCRKALGISYNDFYSSMYDFFVSTQSEVRFDFDKMKTNMYSLLSTGKIIDSDEFESGNHIAFAGYVTFYLKKQQVIDIAIAVAEKFGAIPDDVKQLQNMFVFDVGQALPFTIDMKHDIDTWEKTPTQYEISTKIKLFEPTYFHITAQRKRGNLKNTIVKINK